MQTADSMSQLVYCQLTQLALQDLKSAMACDARGKMDVTVVIMCLEMTLVLLQAAPLKGVPQFLGAYKCTHGSRQQRDVNEMQERVKCKNYDSHALLHTLGCLFGHCSSALPVLLALLRPAPGQRQPNPQQLP